VRETGFGIRDSGFVKKRKITNEQTRISTGKKEEKVGNEQKRTREQKLWFVFVRCKNLFSYFGYRLCLFLFDKRRTQGPCFGLRISDYGSTVFAFGYAGSSGSGFTVYGSPVTGHWSILFPNPESRIPSTQSRIPNPESRIPSTQSRIPNPESRILVQENI